MSAKDKLISRMSTLEATLLLPVLVNQTNGSNLQNSSATLLRKGLGIVIFNILEDFIKERATEMFSSISSSLTNFNLLPEYMQEAATLGALKGVAAKAALEKKTQGNWLGLIQQETMHINSTSLVNGFTISGLSLMAVGSNVYVEDIPNAMKCLNIEGGWETLQKISNLTNGGIPSLRQSFMNISSRRHSAAHVANFDYELGWLNDSVNEIYAIASSFDVALTARCRELSANPSVALVKAPIHNIIKCRFLVHNVQKNYYSEKNSITSRSIKNWPNFNTAIQTIAPKCLPRKEYLITLNSQSRITNWFS